MACSLLLLHRVATPIFLWLVILAMPSATVAQDWPKRPVTLVIPYAPGGSTDLIARLVAPRLAAELGQPVLLENMAGVGGIAGVSRVAKAAANGYQVVLGNVGTHAQNQFLSSTPEPIVARLNAVATTALADQTLQKTLRALGAEPVAVERNTPERLAAFLAAEREKWGTIIRKANIRLE